jgi:hypothetical protein
VSAHVFYLELQLLLCALLGALSHALVTASSIAIEICPYFEGQMLEKVCGSIGPVRLCAASGINPNTDSRGLGPRGMLGSDLRSRVNCSPDDLYSGQPTVKPF